MGFDFDGDDDGELVAILNVFHAEPIWCLRTRRA